MTIADAELSGRIEALSGMDRLLPALDGLPATFLVGGAVRDLLLGATTVDLDVAVEGDAAETARELAARLDGEVTEHERFGTATVRSGTLAVDLATTRRERYPAPGALPEVEPAPLAEDLGRRDFAINAMAATLSPGQPGRLVDPHGGVDDLRSRIVRVLHPASFLDDPTRLLRAVRYEARLGFEMDAGTEARAREAAAGALASVSGPRVRDELLDLLAEPGSAAGVARLRDLGLDRAMHPRLAADPDLVAGASLGAAETGADRVLAALAALVSAAPAELRGWLEDLHLGRDRTDRVARAAARGEGVADELREDLPPSGIRRLLAPEPPEALALALARGAPAESILRYVRGLRDVRLEVTGDDLIAEGIEPSPALGRALEETLDRKLDGEVSGREEELRAAVEIARAAAPEGGAR
jgi:tRNA nucleotidyltransferase (CCA-adding enzyme)